ncbi:MAG: NERD domain-containing protein [Clostridia bacterium]|nr:NERD domain-containing protein [Clostridia bacterium]
MEYLTPIFMCIVFLCGCALLCTVSLYISDRLTVRSLRRSPVLDRDSVAALLSLEFGTGNLYLSRWFPVRSPRGTLYTEIPLILVLGRKVFVCTVCPASGIIYNTEEETWRISLAMQNGTKKTIAVKNPVKAAEQQADVIRALLETANLPFPVSVEPLAILTAKQHKLDDPEQQGIGILPEALQYIHASFPKKHTDKKKTKQVRRALKQDTESILRIFRRYSLSRAKAIAKINALRQNKK